MSPHSHMNGFEFSGTGIPLIGQTLVKGGDAYTPWVPGLGDAVTIAVEVIARSGGNLTVTVQHKNRGTLDSSATSEATTISANTVNVFRQRYTAIKQLLRLKFSVTGTNTLDWSHFRMLVPIWEANSGGGLVHGTVPVVPAGMLGVTLFKGITVYTAWSPRRGNNATFPIDAVAVSNATLTATIQHRQIDATDASITDLGTTVSATTAGIATARNTDLKELWRYKLAITGTNDYDWIHFKLPQPQWEGH